ncbi:MAG: flagellar biosynthetic protein FliR [Verrucomicrobia bacterium]|nr:flagellar biosynthetic protein FliR [Verrucomicrobiota bacterium]MBI3871069.1 flagellar biosynthetic protein FliR [Verrucomicrobiota bacterium]
MHEIYTGAMVFARCSALLLTFPIFASPQFPARLRISLALFVAVLITPGLASQATLGLGFWDLVADLLREVAVGLLLGFVGRLTFNALEFFAGIVGMEVGVNMAFIFNPLSESRTEVFGTLAYLLGAMLLFTLDLHHWMLGAFQRSYALVPIHRAGISMPLYHGVMSRVSEVFQAGFIMAAPVVAISFLISVTFAMLSRAVPSMNVFAESFGFRILAGLMVTGFTLNLTAQHAANYLRRLPDDLARVAKMMALT